MREKQISKFLNHKTPTHIPDLVKKMYPQLDSRLIKAAGWSVLAHLLHMEEMKLIKSIENDANKGWLLLK